MAFKTNYHVERLHRYLPFSPDHDQIYEEYQTTKDALNLHTKALEYLLHAARSGSRLVVLTGDAGHGKTHLCRRLLQEHLGFRERDAREAINSQCDGDQAISAIDDRIVRPLRIFKDFSEPPVDLAAKYIEDSHRRDNELLVICANEGRLRAVFKSDNAGEVCSALASDFRESFDSGLASQSGETHIINLNYQSVAADSDRSLVQSALHQWLSGNRWRACTTCDARKECSIYRNRQMLAEEDCAAVRQERVEKIFSTAERLGAVITIRDMLMAIAYVITGGLRCSDVHGFAERGKRGWQNKYAFYNLLFVPPPSIPAENLARIPALQYISHLDPGLRAPRSIDERLVNTADAFNEDDTDLVFTSPSSDVSIDAAHGIDDIIGNPRNHKERLKEAEFVQRVVRSLRRRAFFDAQNEQGGVLARLGFEFGDEFEELVDGNVEPARMAALKGRVISGLHVMQGLHMSSAETNLHLVDPAFGSATAHAAIVARRIPSRDVSLVPLSKDWGQGSSGEENSLTRAVDWLDRCIVLRLHTSDTEVFRLHLDLLMFDCIARAGTGYVAEDFYAHDIRKIQNFLGRIAEQSGASDGEISLFLDRRLRSVSIDEGVIQVGG